MQSSEKITAAIEIFKAVLSGAKSKFRAYISETNSNEVEFFNESGLYCVVNIRSGSVRGI